MSNQGLRQASARSIYGGSADVPYNEDFMRMFTAEGVPVAGTFNERFLQWLNIRLSRTYTNLPEAQTAFAVSLGVVNWDSVGTFTAFATPPVNTVAPVISGTPQVGQTLTSTTGTWTGTAPITYAYQWKSGASNVGTNANTYVPVTGDIGANITCVVTATNAAGSVDATSNSLGPVIAAFSAWSASAKSVDITLTNSDRTATRTASTTGSTGTVKSTTSKTTGKWHFEVTVVAPSVFIPDVGMAAASLNVNGGITTDVGGIGISPAGDVSLDGAVIGAGDAFVGGSIIAVEYDADGGQVYFQKAGGTGRKGPFNASATYFAALSCPALTGMGGTINVGNAAFAITPTSGYSAWG